MPKPKRKKPASSALSFQFQIPAEHTVVPAKLRQEAYRLAMKFVLGCGLPPQDAIDRLNISLHGLLNQTPPPSSSPDPS